MRPVRRVVVTGLGAVTPLGVGVTALWEGLKAGKSGIAKITLFDPSEYPVQFGGEVKGYKPEEHFDRKEVRHLDRTVQFALVASEEARRDSGLDLDRVDRERAGVIVGSGIGGLWTIEEETRTLINKGMKRVTPFFVPMMMINAASGHLAIKHGLKGPNMCVSSACATGNHALGIALQQIRHGYADLMFAGSAEAALTPIGLAGFCQARALSKRNDAPEKASRPFDKDRDGFVFGEGAGVVVLEELEHAKKRGAKIYCELAGFGQTDDAFHITAPAESGDGAYRAMKIAIADAGVEGDRVQYINAHGTSTELNDKMETAAIKQLFGERAYKIAVSSTKSSIGHLLGGAAGVEAIATALAIRDRIAPPTINYTTKDPDCDLDYVPNEARPLEIDVALSNSFGFGGHNACIALRRFTG
jgi:3-oxoacyl-[acyl-carrier-protein] synthase II